jgi:hypothetical protein
VWAHFAIFRVFWLAKMRSGKEKNGPATAAAAVSLMKSRRETYFLLTLGILTIGSP